MNKAWYKSKTLWINLVAIIGIIFFGKNFSVETVGIALTVINFLLRLITKKEVVWTE